MILIPEIETVVILVPRTASGSLRRAVAARYPKSILLYRHMEACGIPHGYDRWKRVGVVRDPIDRLWSLFKFCQSIAFNEDTSRKYPAWADKMRRATDRPFDDWLINNDVPFSTPFDSENMGRYWAEYTVHHALPENRKSQWMYLRPDRGCTVYRFDELHKLERNLDISLGRTNVSRHEPTPVISPVARAHLQGVCAWDFQQTYPGTGVGCS